MAQPDSGTIGNLTRCFRLPGFYPVGAVDQFIRVLPFQESGGYGRAVEINRATSLGDVLFYDPATVIAANQGVTSLSLMTFSRLGGTAQVDDADIDASGAPNDQLELQVAMRKVQLIRTLGGNALLGSGVAPIMAGLLSQLVGAQVLDLAGAAPTLANYHQLVALVHASDGYVGTGADALVMNFNARRQLTALLEAAGGPPCYAVDPLLGVPTLQFDGLPVYVTDAIPVPAPSTTVFAIKLQGSSGIRMLHIGGRSSEFGIVVDDVPNQLTVSQRAKIVRGYYALMIPEQASAAALTNAGMAGFTP